MALGVTLAACGSPVSGTPSPAPGRASAPAAAAGAPNGGAPNGGAPSGAERTGDEAAVQAAFVAYNQALLTRDWRTACGLAAPATKAKLVENLRSRGRPEITECEPAYAALYADGAKAAAADGIAGTAEIERIAVSGDTAAVTWSGTYNGQRPIVTNQLLRVEGKWLLLDTTG